jgi:hypothetical protein
MAHLPGNIVKNPQKLTRQTKREVRKTKNRLNSFLVKNGDKLPVTMLVYLLLVDKYFGLDFFYLYQTFVVYATKFYML